MDELLRYAEEYDAARRANSHLRMAKAMMAFRSRLERHAPDVLDALLRLERHEQDAN